MCSKVIAMGIWSKVSAVVKLVASWLLRMSMRCVQMWLSEQVIAFQHTATHCNTLQHTAMHCNALQRTATHCDALQHTATHSNTLQHTATHCIALQRTATHCNALQRTATGKGGIQRTCAPASTRCTSFWGCAWARASARANAAGRISQKSTL